MSRHEHLPAAVSQLDAYEAAILSDGSQTISTQQKQAVELTSRNWGRIILAGGENTYGKDGYSETPTERRFRNVRLKKRPNHRYGAYRRSEA